LVDHVPINDEGVWAALLWDKREAMESNNCRNAAIAEGRKIVELGDILGMKS
jgi:hypothetical protein